MAFLFQDPNQFAAEVNKFLTDPTAEGTIETDSYQITVADDLSITAAEPPAATSKGTRPPTTGPPEQRRSTLLS